jgi:hypothetical protein
MVCFYFNIQQLATKTLLDHITLPAHVTKLISDIRNAHKLPSLPKIERALYTDSMTWLLKIHNLLVSKANAFLASDYPYQMQTQQRFRGNIVKSAPTLHEINPILGGASAWYRFANGVIELLDKQPRPAPTAQLVQQSGEVIVKNPDFERVYNLLNTFLQTSYTGQSGVQLANLQPIWSYHGSSALGSILQSGLDPGRRKGQVYGPGEYSSMFYHVANGYSNAGTVLLCLSLKTTGYHQNYCYVVNNPLDWVSSWMLPLGYIHITDLNNQNFPSRPQLTEAQCIPFTDYQRYINSVATNSTFIERARYPQTASENIAVSDNIDPSAIWSFQLHGNSAPWFKFNQQAGLELETMYQYFRLYPDDPKYEVVNWACSWDQNGTDRIVFEIDWLDMIMARNTKHTGLSQGRVAVSLSREKFLRPVFALS